MKNFDNFSTSQYTMLISNGNRMELPICIPNCFGAEVIAESDGVVINSCGTEVKVNGTVVASALLKPGDIVQLGDVKLSYSIAATGTRKLAVFNPESDDIKLRSWIIAQQELCKQKKRGKAPIVTKPPVITVSRQLGSGGTEIAKRLGQELGWNVWDRDIIDKIADDANTNREMVELLDERGVSVFEELFRALFSVTSTLTWETYLKHLIGTIMVIGQQGKAIIVGRGANFILPEVLNVRIIASFDYRLENLMKRNEISQREAERYIVQSDQDRADFINKAFGADIDDVALYDLILRMDEFSLENATQIIRNVVQMKFEYLAP